MAARKLASRARNKIAQPAAEDTRPDWQLVDAFLAAARGGDLSRLLELLASDVVVTADADAVALGTPSRIEGAEPVAGFFNGAAKAALPVLLDERPGAAWYHQGQAKVVFDFQLAGGAVTEIVFRAAPDVLARIQRRRPSS